MLDGGTAGRMASAEPAAPAPLPERAAALEREIARVQALAEARASIASRLEAELSNLARRLSALRLQNAILAAENSRLTLESLAADTRLRRLTGDVETGRGEYAALLAKYGDSEARAGRLQARVTELQERLASNRPDPDAVAAARARITELHKAYRTLRAARPQDSTRKAALESTQSALQRGQIELALLTGARGVYTVQEGDSLTRISRFFYRDPGRWQAIFRANEILLSRPGQIAPGIVLLIPR
jgi:nucleoid-associated protein YgaU